MSLLGNLIWIIFGGILGALLWTIAGLLCCITVIGIPVGLQCFKIGSLSLAPFGKEVEMGRFGAVNLLANVIWIVVLGWELCLFHIAVGLIMCITVVGMPFGIQHFKLAGLALVPFGARIE